MQTAWTIFCIASLLSGTLLGQAPPFYRPPVGYGGFNYRSAFEDHGTPQPRNLTGEPRPNLTPVTPVPVARAGPVSGHALGAWAIVGIVLALLAAGSGAYFAVLCYPVLCRRRVPLHDQEVHV
ncbi:uncharacterized protein LOC134532481 isoform X1 [Bacillus rossius redtenbacheri]|uniref:uncharacterized protein LOC134532481 isoform X1 n=1 Tax=Bacillus rossius redtenbacheri TaxID=93214 RepID=UPI002FDEEE74